MRTEKPSYQLFTFTKLPPTLSGRPKSVNNDADLIKEALQLMKKGTAKNYYQAALMVAPKSRTYCDGVWKRVGAPITIVNRLRRAISYAYRQRQKPRS